MRFSVLSLFLCVCSAWSADKVADVELRDGRVLTGVRVSEAETGIHINNGLTRTFYEKARVRSVTYHQHQPSPDVAAKPTLKSRTIEELSAENYELRAQLGKLLRENKELSLQLKRTEVQAGMNKAASEAMKREAHSAYAETRQTEEKLAKARIEGEQAKLESEIAKGRAIGAEVEAAKVRREADIMAADSYINGLKDGHEATQRENARAYVNGVRDGIIIEKLNEAGK